MRYEVEMLVVQAVTVTVETDNVLQIEELARASVNAPAGARVSVQEIRNAPASQASTEHVNRLKAAA